MNSQWKELCKEIEEEVLEKYGVEEGTRGAHEGSGDEYVVVSRRKFATDM